MIALWPDGFQAEFTIKRFPWWLKWWPSRNVTFGRTIYEGGPVGINDATLAHELRHVRQYAERGWWWVWTHPRQREQEAHAAEKPPYPIWS